jgi:hypothetical protein
MLNDRYWLNLEDVKHLEVGIACAQKLLFMT